MKIFVSNDISEKGVALLREHFDVDVMPNMKPEELIKVINNYDGLVTRSMTKVTKEVIEASTRLKVIGRAGVGVDNIDIPLPLKASSYSTPRKATPWQLPSTPLL